MSSSSKIRKWAIDLGEASSSVSRDLPDPPGFNRLLSDADESISKAAKSKELDTELKQQKAWEIAQSPIKNMFPMLVMMYFAGNSIHMFSIGITVSALWQPVNALKMVNKVFEPLQDSRINILLPKLSFILINIVALCVGFWKLNGLGLLPTHASDWLSSLPPVQELEFSSGGV